MVLTRRTDPMTIGLIRARTALPARRWEIRNTQKIKVQGKLFFVISFLIIGLLRTSLLSFS
jgi:hypothetical protein